MEGTLKKLKDALDTTGAGYVEVKIGKYTIIMTDDEEGANRLSEAWGEYANEDDEV